ncbi:hypothetical protein IWQ60_000574 [Tieghemiomyces parasiticus]|uniref:Complex 1 LYR protein domain-containing protein n=1 Tax=Tieghemiomyces parasiticus TaxID=78921 RepID=A0A9W8AMF3_9FUNG|nr:hypothetical protein IWQ60_010232 [Tieghemiomyces parasiticus]KAJ1930100.1 hypothetical protein IWQ60_000574 [Tieghemiomyces parasiticus]
MAPNQATLTLFRTAIRVVRQFPILSLRNKTLYNVRDAINIYRYESDPHRIAQLVRTGYEDLQWLSEWRQLPPETLQKLVKLTLNKH